MTVLKIKSGAGGTWEEVGGIGLGVPAGGTTGQVLTKSSAADYATAWGTNQPILSNASYLQGYKADGTTAQPLIGMTTGDEISIGPSLAAGKQIYVPCLTVQGPLTLTDQQYVQSSTGHTIIIPHAPNNTIYFAHNQNATFNTDAGNTLFVREVIINGVLYKGGVAYTHPDYILEHYYTGRMEQFATAHGAKDYAGLLPLDEVERHTRETLRLPGARGERYDLFARGDELLAEVEQIYLQLFALNRRVKELEGR